MARACVRRGGQAAPYTRRRKSPYDYTALYKRHPNLRHWKHNLIAQGFAKKGTGL